LSFLRLSPKLSDSSLRLPPLSLRRGLLGLLGLFGLEILSVDDSFFRLLSLKGALATRPLGVRTGTALRPCEGKSRLFTRQGDFIFKLQGIKTHADDLLEFKAPVSVEVKQMHVGQHGLEVGGLQGGNKGAEEPASVSEAPHRNVVV
jgi:hypothetical protein